MDQIITQFNVRWGTVIVGDSGNKLDQQNYNFQNCNFELQGALNELNDLFDDSGRSKDAKEVKKIIELLEKNEDLKTSNELTKKGVSRRLKKFFDNLGDEKTGIHKAIKNVKGGIELAQELAGYYNDAAQWLGMPVVPKPFLKKGEKGE